MANSQPSGILFASGTLATLTGLATTAVQLIATPGASKIIIVHHTWLNVKNGTVPWTGVGNVWLVYGTGGNDQVNLASGLITNVVAGGTASTNYAIGSVGSIGSDWLGGSQYTSQRIASAASTNQPVSITCSNAPADGNGTVDWRVWYSVIPAA